MGKRRPSDSEKEQITKELAGVPREWIKRFAESGWELMYYTDKAYFSAPKTEQGIYFVNYDTDVHYKKIKFSKPQGLAMAFGEFAASELSDEETSRALAGSGLVQPLPSYFDDKSEMQFGSFFAACCDEDVRADIRKNSPELYKYVVKLGFWQEGQKPDEAEGVEMNSDPEFAGNGAGPAGDESLKVTGHVCVNSNHYSANSSHFSYNPSNFAFSSSFSLFSFIKRGTSEKTVSSQRSASIS